MAKLKIGGESYTVPEMNFIAIELAWPYIEEATNTLDPMKGPAAALYVIAAALMEADDFDPARFGISPTRPDRFNAGVEVPKDAEVILSEIVYFFKKKLRATEIPAVRDCMFDILREAGMEPEDPASGEAEAVPEAASPSPVTAPDTSLSSSPLELKEEAGTE